MEALGAVEAKGWAGAIEAAGAMVNPAKVVLTGEEHSRAGLVMVTVRADGGTVRASAGASAIAARRVNLHRGVEDFPPGARKPCKAAGKSAG